MNTDDDRVMLRGRAAPGAGFAEQTRMARTEIETSIEASWLRHKADRPGGLDEVAARDVLEDPSRRPWRLVDAAAAAWGDAPFSGTRHDAVLFSGVDLSDVVQRGAAFTDCTFRDVRFNASSHTDALFSNCTFVACRFFDTRFTRCKLVGSMFDRCTYKLFVVEGGDWSLVGMPGADLRKCEFSDVRMREADLTGARFDGATLRDVDLSGAWLHRASFRKTDLRGSDLSALDPLNAEIGGARIDYEQATVIAEALGMRVG